MVINQVIRGIDFHKQEMSKNVVARKPDLTYDLESILEKILDKVEVKNI